MEFAFDHVAKATTASEYKYSTGEVSDDALAAQYGLAYCVDAPPDGLGLKEGDVLKASPSDALKKYTDYQIQTVKDKSWILSEVAMIPCIQVSYIGYYMVSVDTCLWIVLLSNR